MPQLDGQTPSATAPKAYLLMRSFSTDAAFAQFAQAAEPACAAQGGRVFLSQPIHRVQTLEPGAPGCHLWAAEFATRAARDAAWRTLESAGVVDLLTAQSPPVVLAMDGLPPEGLPDPSIPTAANITPPDSAGPPAYMLIEGSVSDQARIDAYRDVILPMIGALGGFYTVFAFASDVAVLSGAWTDQVAIISRWPDVAAAHAFWLSERYQTVAIPKRLGAGDFRVWLAPEAASICA
jgi:uncharacterized protein (DUF1330 family)